MTNRHRRLCQSRNRCLERWHRHARNPAETRNRRRTLLSVIAKETIDAFALATQWNQFDEDAGKEAGLRRKRAALVLALLVGLLQDALRISHGVSPLVAGPDET